MPTNDRFIDNSVSNITGTYISGNAQVSNVTTVVYKSEPTIDWSLLQKEFDSAISEMDKNKQQIFVQEYDELGQAINERDESKLKRIASKLGKYGITLLQDLSANVLSGILLKMIGC